MLLVIVSFPDASNYLNRETINDMIMYNIYFVTEILRLILAKPADCVYAVGSITLFTS